VSTGWYTCPEKKTLKGPSIHEGLCPGGTLLFPPGLPVLSRVLQSFKLQGCTMVGLFCDSELLSLISTPSQTLKQPPQAPTASSIPMEFSCNLFKMNGTCSSWRLLCVSGITQIKYPDTIPDQKKTLCCLGPQQPRPFLS